VTDSLTSSPAKLVLGCMNFGRRTPEAEASRILDCALDHGIVRLDTANSYGDGDGERLLGRLLQGRRGQVHLTSKVGLLRVDGQPEGLGAASVLSACEASLQRLGTDHLDLYLLHAPDPLTPVDETLAALATLLTQGKITAWGVSNFAAWQVAGLSATAATLGLPPPAEAQQLYNLLARQIEAEWLPFAQQHGLATSAYNPLAGGLLAGGHRFEVRPSKAGRFGNPYYRRRYWRLGLFQALGLLAPLAECAGMNVFDLALRWLRNRPGLSSVVIGPGSLLHLQATLAAGADPLPDGLARAVEDVAHDWLLAGLAYNR
jgi:aryl-alcohol dehydrogenase-like predicted oxidoreductase